MTYKEIKPTYLPMNDWVRSIYLREHEKWLFSDDPNKPEESIANAACELVYSEGLDWIEALNQVKCKHKPGNASLDPAVSKAFDLLDVLEKTISAQIKVVRNQIRKDLESESSKHDNIWKTFCRWYPKFYVDEMGN